MIILGQFKSYLIILKYSCSTHIVFRNEIQIRPIIIRLKAPGIFFSLVEISGKSQFIWFNLCEKVISSLHLVLIHIFLLLYEILSVLVFNYYLANMWMKIYSDYSICPRHTYFGGPHSLFQILILMDPFECIILILEGKILR